MVFARGREAASGRMRDVELFQAARAAPSTGAALHDSGPPLSLPGATLEAGVAPRLPSSDP
jgi:hypothetical protein